MITGILFAVGLLILVGGADVLVRGSVRLSVMAGVSPLVIGLTVVAFGTSAPELAVSVISAWNGEADIAVGNVVGSNILNLLLVLGLAAAIAPLAVPRRLLHFDVAVMIALSLALWWLAEDGRISGGDGLLLLACLTVYVVYTLHRDRRRPPAERETSRAAVVSRDGAAMAWSMSVMQVAAGLVMLTLGAHWMVEGAVSIAAALGVSKLIVGLTVVAVGTSLPELATSAVAAVRGERDIAVGNAVGSNIFNLLAVLGFSSLAAHDGLTVSPQVLAIHIPVMVAAALVCAPVFFTGGRISRGEGLLFLGYYAAYTAYLVMTATRNPLIAGYRVALLIAVLLTAVILLVSVVRELRTLK